MIRKLSALVLSLLFVTSSGAGLLQSPAVNRTHISQLAVAAAAGGGSSFACDDFTGTNGTNLEAHTPSGSGCGGTWTVQGSNTTAFMKIDTNHAYCAIAGDWSVYYISPSPADADYSVQALVHINAGTSTGGGVAGRINTTTGAGYMAYYSGGAAAWRLVSFDGASETIIGTYAGDSPATADRVAKVSMNGTTIALLIDTVSRISVTNSAVAAAGKAGLIPNFFDNGSDRYLDNFTASDTP